MKALQFTPLMGEANRPDIGATPIQELQGTGGTYALRLHDKGGLTASRLTSGNDALASKCGSGEVIAPVSHRGDFHDPAWILIARESSVGRNGQTPPAISFPVSSAASREPRLTVFDLPLNRWSG